MATAGVSSETVDGVTWDFITFPNGERIIYIDSNHSYWLCKEDGSRGKRLTSVSTVVGPWGFNPEFLMKWGAEKTLEGVVRALAGKPVPKTADALNTILVEEELTHEHIRDQAADRGNIAHDWLEALTGFGDYPSLEDVSEVEQHLCGALTRWWDASDYEPLASEQFVYDKDNRFSGRLDLRVWDRLNAGVKILDLKTSKRIYAKMFVQLAGYDLGSIACGHGAARELVILHCPEGAEIATEVVGSATHEDFLLGLNLYRRSLELQRGC